MSASITQEDIKLQNRRRIISYLRRVREATKQEIAQQTKISIPTVAANIAELLDEGVLVEAGMRKSTGGRKPLALRFIPAARIALGIDLEPRGGRIVAVDLDFHQVAEHHFKFPIEAPKLLSRLEAEIVEFLDSAGIAPERIDGLGIALPGTVDPKRSLLEVAPNLRLRDIDFSRLGEALDVPITVQNEANAGVWAEWLAGENRISDTMIYLSVTEGLGGGLIINRRLFLGSGAMAGELGHMVTVPQGRPCNCGQLGCWERYVSETALLRGDGAPINALEDFFAGVDAEEAELLSRWQAYIQYLASGIRNLIVLFDPDSVVIGGEIAHYGAHLIPSLRKAVALGGSSIMDRDVSIRVAKLSKNAPVQGAAILSFSERYI